MPINKAYRLTQCVDDLIDSLRGSDRWIRSYPMHTTLAKVNKELVSDEII